MMLLSFCLAYEVDFLDQTAREEWQNALKAMDEASSTEQYDKIMNMIPRLPNPFRLQSDYLDLSKQPKIQVSSANHVNKKGFKLISIDVFHHPVYQSYETVEHYNSQILPHLQKLFDRVSSAQKTVTIEFKAKAEKDFNGDVFLYWEPARILGDIITPFLQETKGEFAAVLLKPLEKFDYEGLQFGAHMPLEITLYAIPKKYESVLKMTPQNGNFFNIDTTALNIKDDNFKLVGSLYCENRVPEHTWLLPLKNAIVFSPLSTNDHEADCQPGFKDHLSETFVFGGTFSIKSQANKFSVSESKIGEDYIAVTYNRIINKLYENNLLPRELEQKLRKMNRELYWAYGRALLGNAADAYAAPADADSLYINARGLSSEELSLIWLSDNIAHRVCSLLMGIDPDREPTMEQLNIIQYAQAHLAITTLNLMEYGPYTEKMINSNLHSDQAKGKIGKWNSQRHLLDLSQATADKGAESHPEEQQIVATPAPEQQPLQEKAAPQADYAPSPYWQQELVGIDQASTEQQYEELLTAFAQKLPAPFGYTAQVLSQPTVTIKNEGKVMHLTIGDAEANIYPSTASLKYYNEHIFPRLQKLLAHFSKAVITKKVDFNLKFAGRLTDDLTCSPEDDLAPQVNQLLKSNRNTFVVALMRPLFDNGDCSAMDSLPMEVDLYALPKKYEKMFREKDNSINRYKYVAFHLLDKQTQCLGSRYCENYNDWKLKMGKGYAFMPLAQISDDGIDTADSVYVYSRSYIPASSYSLCLSQDAYGIQLSPVKRGMDYLSRINVEVVDLLYSYGLLPSNAYDKLIRLDDEDLRALALQTAKGEDDHVIVAPFDRKSSCIETSGMTDDVKTIVWIAEHIAYKAVTHLMNEDENSSRMKSADRETMIKTAQARLAVTLLNLTGYKETFQRRFTENDILPKYRQPREDLLIGKWDAQQSVLDLSRIYKGENSGDVRLSKSKIPPATVEKKEESAR